MCKNMRKYMRKNTRKNTNLALNVRFIVLQKGIKVKLNDNKKIHINVYVHAFISDEPGRAKTCYCKQHNGRFGCLFCLNEGVSIGRNSRCWPGINSHKNTRTLQRSCEIKCTYRGF